MKNIKNIKILFLTLAMLIAGISCDNGFDDMLENPNAPLESPGRLVLAGAQADLSYYASYQLGINYIGLWVQQHASGAYPDEDQYSPRLNDINVYWNNIYDNSMRDFKYILEKPEERPDLEEDMNLRAIALIMSAYGYMALTDVWGDIPYSEALNGAKKITTPIFDTQEEVYTGIIADLDKAADIIDMSKEERKDIDFTGEDLVYKGNMDKWMRFANSLRLRAFMHLSNVKPAVAEAGVVEMLGKPLISKQDQNAAIGYSTISGSKNPVHSRTAGRENDFRVSESIVSRMIGNGSSTAPQDPRLPVYAELNDAGYEDLNGNKKEDPGEALPDEYVGIPNGIKGLSEVKLTNATSSKIGALYTAADAPAYFMTYAEVEFIRAEAAARGWIADVPAIAYNNAIKVSMEQNGITDAAAITTFLTAPNIAYDPATGQEQIATQKWIALFGQSIESWTNWRRTGFPDIPVARNDKNNGVIPRRLMYGSVEATTNATNVAAATARQGGAELSNRVWWDK